MEQPKTLSQELLLLFLLAVVTAAASYGIVKLVHKPVQKAAKGIDAVPAAWENALKQRIVKYLENDSRTVDDPTMSAAVDSIKARLLAHERDTASPVDIMVVESETVNAVTFPGGLIVVFTPLIRLTDSPEELATVVAHELGHVAHRDPLKQMAREVGVSTVLSMLNGGRAMPMVESMIKDFLDVQYTREQEQAADAYAFKLLSRNGINPEYFAVFMEKIASGSSDTGTAGRAADYFNTHPNTESRIADAKAAAKSFDPKSEKPFRIDWKVVKRNLPSIFDE